MVHSWEDLTSLVRHAAQPQRLTLNFSNNTSVVYNSAQRDHILAAVLKITSSTASSTRPLPQIFCSDEVPENTVIGLRPAANATAELAKLLIKKLSSLFKKDSAHDNDDVHHREVIRVAIELTANIAKLKFDTMGNIIYRDTFR